MPPSLWFFSSLSYFFSIRTVASEFHAPKNKHPGWPSTCVHQTRDKSAPVSSSFSSFKQFSIFTGHVDLRARADVQIDKKKEKHERNELRVTYQTTARRSSSYIVWHCAKDLGKKKNFKRENISQHVSRKKKRSVLLAPYRYFYCYPSKLFQWMHEYMESIRIPTATRAAITFAGASTIRPPLDGWKS